MKTTMTQDFVTTQTFNRAMENIDCRFEAVGKRFESVDKRFDSIDSEFKVVHRDIDDLRTMIRETMEEQRVIFNNDMHRYVGAMLEEFKGYIKALAEHPVFTTYKA